MQCVFYAYSTSQFGLATFQVFSSHMWPVATLWAVQPYIFVGVASSPRSGLCTNVTSSEWPSQTILYKIVSFLSLPAPPCSRLAVFPSQLLPQHLLVPDNILWMHLLAFTFYLFICLFVCLFLAVLSLCCCMRAFSSCGKRGLLFIAVHGLLIAVASLVVVEHGL